MHTVFALLCFVVVIHWLIFPYPSGLLHWHCGNLTIAPVPAKQPWWKWINIILWIHYERLHNHNKAKHHKTVCIFLGTYCISSKGKCSDMCNFTVTNITREYRWQRIISPGQKAIYFLLINRVILMHSVANYHILIFDYRSPYIKIPNLSIRLFLCDGNGPSVLTSEVPIIEHAVCHLHVSHHISERGAYYLEQLLCSNHHIINILKPEQGGRTFRSKFYRNKSNLSRTYICWAKMGPLNTQIARFKGQTWGPPGSCRPQVGPILAPWTLQSGCIWYCAAYRRGGTGSPIIWWIVCYWNGMMILSKSTMTQITKFMWPTWGPPGPCRPQDVGPMNLAIRGPITSVFFCFFSARGYQNICFKVGTFLLAHWILVTHISANWVYFGEGKDHGTT